MEALLSEESLSEDAKRFFKRFQVYHSGILRKLCCLNNLYLMTPRGSLKGSMIILFRNRMEALLSEESLSEEAMRGSLKGSMII